VAVSDRAGLPVRSHGGLVLASVGLGAALLEPAEVIIQRLQPDPAASVIDAVGRNDVHFLIVRALLDSQVGADQVHDRSRRRALSALSRVGVAGRR
jgi:hypothetical protein